MQAHTHMQMDLWVWYHCTQVVTEEEEPLRQVCTIETPCGEYRKRSAKEKLLWALKTVKNANRFNIDGGGLDSEFQTNDQRMKLTQVLMIGKKRSWRCDSNERAVAAHYDKRDLLYDKRDLLYDKRALFCHIAPVYMQDSLVSNSASKKHHIVGLFCHIVGLFCHIVGLFCHIVGLFCHIVSLSCHIGSLLSYSRSLLSYSRSLLYMQDSLVSNSSRPTQQNEAGFSSRRFKQGSMKLEHAACAKTENTKRTPREHRHFTLLQSREADPHSVTFRCSRFHRMCYL
jgi:hypothetical protein